MKAKHSSSTRKPSVGGLILIFSLFPDPGKRGLVPEGPRATLLVSAPTTHIGVFLIGCRLLGRDGSASPQSGFSRASQCRLLSNRAQNSFILGKATMTMASTQGLMSQVLQSRRASDRPMAAKGHVAATFQRRTTFIFEMRSRFLDKHQTNSIARLDQLGISGPKLGHGDPRGCSSLAL